MLVKDLLKRQYCSVSEQDTISTLLGKCRRSKHFYAVILDKKGYKGMADKKKLLSLNIDASKTKASKVLVRAPLLDPNDTIENAARKFFTSGLHALAVGVGKEVKGVVRATDVLVALRSSFRGMKANQVSSNNLLVLEEHEPISKVTSWFKQKGIGRVPIVDDKGRLIGICTAEDILYKYHLFPTRRGGKLRGKSKGSPAEEMLGKGKLPVGNLSSLQVITVKPTDSVTKAVDLFAQYGISSVVVATGNKPVGIIAIKDLLRLV